MPARIPEEEIEKDVVRVFEALNLGYISADLYRKHGKYGIETIRQKYGTWSTLVEQLGIPQISGNILKCTKAELDEDIISTYKKHGGEFTFHVYKEHGKHGEHSEAPIKKYYGTWLNALDKLNIPHKEKNISDEDIIEDLLRTYNDMGGKLLSLEYQEHGKYSLHAVRNHFGTWNNALKAAGLDTNLVIDIPEKDLIDELWRLYDEFGSITQRLVIEESKYSEMPYRNKFGGVVPACQKAGIPTWALGLSHSRIGMAATKNFAKIIGEEPIFEARYDWLRNPETNHPLFADAVFEENKLVFEYNGPQHYDDPESIMRCPSLFKIPNGLEKQIARDQIKEKAFVEHGYSVIWYNYLWPISEKAMRERLSDFLSQAQCSSSPIIYPTSIIRGK